MSIFRPFGKLVSKTSKPQNLLRTFCRIVSPQKVSKTRTVPERIARPTYVYDHQKYEKENQAKYRRSLSKDERNRFRAACVVARRILEKVGELVRPGVTTDFLDEAAHQLCIEQHCYPAPLLYKGFPKSICTSVNNVACHGIPDDRRLCAGDVINIDVTVFKDGFYGDTSHTYIVPSDGGDDNDKGDEEDEDEGVLKEVARMEHLVAAAELCRDEAIRSCRPGRKLNHIGHVISEVARDQGLRVAPLICGHGISSFFHGPPCIHHAENDLEGVMREGMSFTIEPVICEGSGEVEVLEDGWTVVSVDDACSAQFEHTVLITRDAVEVLTVS